MVEVSEQREHKVKGQLLDRGGHRFCIIAFVVRSDDEVIFSAKELGKSLENAMTEKPRFCLLGD